MEDTVTTVLDALAMLAVAAGTGAAAAHWIGWWGLALAGLILTAESLTTIWWRERQDQAGDLS